MSIRYNLYITFPSIHDVLAMEKALKSVRDTSIRFEIVPTPQSLTKSCSSCIKTDEQNKGAILEIARKTHIPVTGVYLMEDKFS
ncbi:MAG: hypothetical protein PWR06_2074 [Thermoanaerobacteraceae bacterium]|uniref:DUF3343 domain-containing protein n=1 Tax=Biomaibacter acetigenes TaxID=2316383 RepID=A0A3G2R770_9FIRM|nr:DUF3343 domain-containing protein [Biomaibacter acetigenes]MDK2879358.1 hypothetical protein [Thermoanaerobacteraceae bacterium]RKL61766.1 DUF3343 domain-containing protein [Thermoanaerobacteraceae bacterium SP2]AYO31271.1 DUF3343 domain-containing protein [Biomaibacter acetigenes]MDN5300981.1 hypothetical protein [Thermoanaerobacteraceae bacterium]MDN5312321.1 hypothetical protein [Thermoanaerobacteraceae bacterium]